MATTEGTVFRLRFADGSGRCVTASKADAVKEAKSVGAVSVETADSDETVWTAKETPRE